MNLIFEELMSVLQEILDEVEREERSRSSESDDEEQSFTEEER